MSYETTVTADLDQATAAWMQFREQIAPEVRDRIAAVVFDGEEPTRAGANRKIAMIMREIFMGNIPPVIEPQLHRWMELLLMNIQTMHQEQGTVHLAGDHMKRAVLESIDVRQIETKRTTQFLLTPGEIRKPELVVVEDEAAQGGKG